MLSKDTPSELRMDVLDYSEELDFRKYWRTIKRRWYVVALISGSVFGLSAWWTTNQPPTYAAVGRLLVQTDKTANLVGSRADSGRIDVVAQKSDPLTTQAEIIRSQSVAQATIKALNLKDEEGNPLDSRAISSNLSVGPITGTDVLRVSYVSDDPQLATVIVNQVMKSYVENNVALNRTDAVAARKFIQDQLPSSEAAVAQAETNLRRFKEANGVVELKEEATATVSGMAALDQQITQAQSELAQVNSRVAELRSQVGMDSQAALSINALNQSEGVQKALTELQLVQSQLAKQQTLYRESHPSVTQLQRQVAAAKAVLQGRVQEILGRNLQVPTGTLQIGTSRQEIAAELAKAEVDRMSMAQRLQALAQARASYQARSQSLPALAKGQQELERQLEAAQTTYKALLAKLPDVQIAANQPVSNAKILAVADVPEEPVSPRVLLNLLTGGIAGVLLGLVAAFLLDYADQSVKTAREAKELFQYTLLGVIPTINSRLPFGSDPVPLVITRDRPNFAAQEAYQMLHANLHFLGSDQELKSIVITSSVRKEGKSTVAANLAAAVAQVQKRVLLVDADMRHPSQHHAWDLLNTVGLSNVIVGQADIRNAVQIITPHLHVLTAGVIPPNPLALLNSKRMSYLVELFSRNYDFVIFDAPSLSGTADAAVLNKMTNGSLLVVRPGAIKTAQIKAAKQFLAQSNQTVLGMVMNHFDIRKEPDSYFYYAKDDDAVVQPDHSSVNV